MNWRSFLIMLWLLACCSVVTAVFDQAARLWPLGFGCLLGVVGLITAWLVFGDGSLAFRGVAAVVMLAGLSWLLSVLLVEAGESAHPDVGRMLMISISEAFVSGAGLLLLRQHGLRLHDGEVPVVAFRKDDRERRQFSVAALLTFVGCAAAIFGAARWAVSIDPSAWVFICVGAMLGGFAVPAICMVWLRGLVALRWAAGGCMVVSLVIGAKFSDFGPVIPAIAVLMLMFITASLAVFRVCGYCLERVPKERRGSIAGPTNTDVAEESPAMPAESRL
jgi:hypothetical protein